MSFTASMAIIQGVVALITIVVAALVGTAKVREVAHSKYVEAIDDLKRISDAKQEAISLRDQKIHDLEQKTFEMTGQIGKLEGFNRRLFEDQIIEEQYRDVLVKLLLEHKISVPPMEK